MNMKVRIQEGGKKIQLLYVLWVLENFSDENKTLKLGDIVKLLADRGYHTDRRSVSRDLRLLQNFGYKIRGCELKPDKNGKKIPMKRGAIWLEREFSDEQLSLLLNFVVYNGFIEKNNKEKLLNSIISLGGKTFKEKHNAESLINGGRICHVEGATILNQLKIIEKAIEDEKKIRFKYASKLKREENNFIYEKEKEYVVSPYWIVSKNGNLYLVCLNHDENQICNCRIDKIKEVEMINASATSKQHTELKDTSVGVYVAEHPNMFTGTPKSIKLKVDKDKIGYVKETFGDFATVQESENYIIVEVTCGELDMFYWAVQYGGFVEVLEPQTLREQIRIYIERVVFNYKARENDKYSLAIKNAIRTKVLDLSGIDLTGKTEHYGLRSVEKVYLSNNNIDNVDFLKDYVSLNELHLENNAVTDISLLANRHGLRTVILRNLKLKNIDFVKDRYFEHLELDLGREVDLSALGKAKAEKITLGQNCAYNATVPWDGWEEKKKKEIENAIDWDKEKDVDSSITSQFPFNFLYDMFGSWHVEPSKLKDLQVAINKGFTKFDEKEQKYLDLRYKQCIISNKDVGKMLGISEKECKNILVGIKERVEITGVCDDLKNYFIPNALNGKINLFDKVWNYVELDEALEK